MTVAEKIRTLRISANFTQEYVANELNISQSTYSSLENGSSKLIIEKAEKLGEIYGVNPSVFFSRITHINSGKGSFSNSGSVTFERDSDTQSEVTIEQRLMFLSKHCDNLETKLKNIANFCNHIEKNYICTHQLNKDQMAGNIVLETLMTHYNLSPADVAGRSKLSIESIENILNGRERMTIGYAQALGEGFTMNAEIFFKENIQTIHINSAHGSISSSGFIKAEANSYLGYVNKQDEKLITRLEKENQELKAKLTKLEKGR